jgi:uncharacterized delta-60 repeat protein
LTFKVESLISSRMNAVAKFSCIRFLTSLGLGCGAVFLAANALAQGAGSLDAGFTLTNSKGATVYTLSPQSNGNIVIGGYLPDEVDGVINGPLTGVQADGELDTSFAPPQLQSYDTLTDKIITKIVPADIPEVFTTVIQSDGKILVGGSFFFIDGKPGYGGLVRLNPDGSLDTSFNAPRFNGPVFAVAPLASGKFIVGGGFTYVGNIARTCVAQLNSDGTFDPGFNPGVFSGSPPLQEAPISSVAAVHSLAVQPDGKIVIGGVFTGIGNAQRRSLARLNTDGSLDGGFVPAAGFNAPSTMAGVKADYSLGQVFDLAVQADSQIVVVGSFRDPASTSLSSPTPANCVYRFNTDGSFDASFNPGGVGTVYSASFAFDSNTFVAAVSLAPDGKIYIGGPFVGYNGHLAHLIVRLNADGTRDTSFNVGLGPTFTVYSLALQTDGKLLAGGDFSSVDHVSRPFVARFETVAGMAPGVVAGIQATRKVAVADGGVKGQFTVTRAGGNPTAELTVSYTVGGTAKTGVDYRALPGILTIPGGRSSAVINVKPVAGGPEHGNRKVTVTLVPTAAYATKPKADASVVVAQHP